ncbi:hypothetical protein NDU88_005966 [Pleurodeles waltl]|uniref:Uncharacterized protein n=1 Tax=Pleurodeles waltl TaxID=8319 RepID=A0AAV7MAW1_PLEWA|nr:hypothetical protein NDU88_005966 [Pleurodeles waltl]
MRGRGRATKQDGRLERELRAVAIPEGRRGREDSRTTHRVRSPSTPTTAATRNHARGPRRSGTQGRKPATHPRPLRPGKRGGVASSEDRVGRARSGKEPAEKAAGSAGAVTTRIHLPTTPTNIRGPSTPHRETGRRSKGVRPLRQPGEEPGQREALQHKRLTPTKINPQTSPPLNESTTISDKDQPTTMDRILQEITTVSRRIEGMDASITSLTLETKSMRSDIAGFQSRVTGLEQRMGSLETQINTSQERGQDFLYLRSKLTDMEDSSRRDNIRVLGIPENEEGSDMQAFLTSTLPKIISLDFDPPLEFQRAHRIGPKCSDNSSRLFPIIACLLQHNQTRQILQVARNQVLFRIDQHDI